MTAVRRPEGQLESNAPRGSLAGLRILVAEDEAIIAMDVQFLLEECGAEVVGPAHTLEDALKLARFEEIDAGILDLRLGKDTIDRAAHALKERGIPFIFYSGQSKGDPLREAWSDYVIVAKPARQSQLMSELAIVLAEDTNRGS
jgi:CheY-like chemotaxis protein